MDAWLERERVQYNNRKPANVEETVLTQVGRRLYHLIYKPLLMKQWNHFPTFLSSDFASQVSIRSDHKTGFYSDTYQALPSEGYATIFDNLLQHDKIHVSTSVRELLFCSQPLDLWQDVLYRPD